MSKNLIIYGYNCHNLGDDLMFAEVINKTNYKNYYFIGDPITPRFIEKDIKFIKRGRLMPLRWKFFSDFAIIGGSVLMGTNEAQESMIEQKRAWFLLNKIFFGRNLIIGANLGPYASKDRYLQKLSEINRFTNKWFVRDRLSKELLEEINATNATHMPDLVMGFDTSSYTVQQNELSLAISVTAINKDGKGAINAEQYEQEIISWIQHYLSKDYQINFISFEDKIDIPVIDKIIEKLAPDTIQKINIIRNENDTVIQTICNASVVISTRFHCMVLAALFSKPQIIYSYSNKTKQFADYYDFTTFEVTGELTNKASSPTSFPADSLDNVKNYARLIEQ